MLGRLVVTSLVLSFLALSCLALPCLALSCFVMSCLVLSCLALSVVCCVVRCVLLAGYTARRYITPHYSSPHYSTHTHTLNHKYSFAHSLIRTAQLYRKAAHHNIAQYSTARHNTQHTHTHTPQGTYNTTPFDCAFNGVRTSQASKHLLRARPDAPPPSPPHHKVRHTRWGVSSSCFLCACLRMAQS